MAGWEAVGTIGNILASLTQGILNPILTKITADENRAFQKQENEITRTREDNAHVREVADLEAAGLSPLASVNGAQASQGIASNQEAPQMDISALNDAIKTVVERETAKETLEEQKREHDENLSHQKKVLIENARQFDENLKLTKEMHDETLKQQMTQFLIQESRLNNQIEVTAEQESRKNKITTSQITYSLYESTCKQWSYNFPKNICTNYDIYLAEKARFDKQLGSFIEWFKGLKVKEPWTEKQRNGGAGINLGAGKQEAENNYSFIDKKHNYGYESNGLSGHAGLNAYGGETTKREGNWIKQGKMEQYIEKYCKENKIARSSFLKFPVYSPKGNELESAK